MCVCVCERERESVARVILCFSRELSINLGLKSICIRTKGTWSIHLQAEGTGKTEDRKQESFV